MCDDVLTENPPTESPGESKRSEILNAVRNPLGFFTVALLVTEGMLATALFSDIVPTHKFYLALVGAGLFTLVVVLVALMALLNPASLMVKEVKELRDYVNDRVAQLDVLRRNLKDLGIEVPPRPLSKGEPIKIRTDEGEHDGESVRREGEI